MTLLSYCQNACDEVGLSRPSSIIGSSDQTAIRCLRYAVRTGREFVKENLAVLVNEHTFSTVASTASYALPSDFDHFVPETFWNRTTNRKMYPMSPEEWQYLNSGLVTAQILDRFRVKEEDGLFFMYPTPDSAETIAYEYVSKNYCETSGGTNLSVWAADTDVLIGGENRESLEEVLEMGIIWRLLNRMGLPYAEEKSEYYRNLRRFKAQTLPRKARLDGSSPQHSNLPDADFPG